MNGLVLFYFDAFFSSSKSLLGVWFISYVATIAFGRFYIWMKKKRAGRRAIKASVVRIDKLVAAAAVMLLSCQALKWMSFSKLI